MLNKELFDEATEKSTRRIREHSFLMRCVAGSITLDELKLYMAQQSKVGAGFTACLCAVMANVPTSTQRRSLAENLFEELGFEDKQSIPHAVMYEKMLKKFEISTDDVVIFPESQSLFDLRERLCRNKNPSHGLAALYRFETMVPPMFVDLLAGFRACGVNEADLEFFTIHASCDDGHAETIRDIMVEIAGKDELQTKIMLDAGAAITDARYDFFTAIERQYAANQGRTKVYSGKVPGASPVERK
jgi:pyrroloquinoline-quinone synthase